MSPNINDVAQKAGVSKSTVSQYLSGRYEYMGADTRERIKEIIESIGYRPNALARSLKNKSTNSVAVIVSSVLNPFFTSIIRGAEDYCKKAGFNLILCNADGDPAKEREYIETLLPKQIDGFLIATTEQNNDYIRNVDKHTPVVLAGRNVPDIGTDAVSVNNFSGISMGVEHLLSLGHRKIALFVLPYSTIKATPRSERVQAFKTVIKNRDHPGIIDWIVEVENDEELIRQKANELLSLGENRPTAFFGANDIMTITLFKVLKQMGVKLPQELALIGFDDWEWAALLDPPISAVAQPTYQMGYDAAELLVARINNKNILPKPQIAVYEPTLVARRSCGEEL